MSPVLAVPVDGHVDEHEHHTLCPSTGRRVHGFTLYGNDCGEPNTKHFCNDRTRHIL